MKIHGKFPVTISVAPNVDSMLCSLEHFGVFDLSDEGEPLVIKGSVSAVCEKHPGRMWMPNGDPGYPDEYEYSPEVDAEDIEDSLRELYPEFDISVSVGEFEED